MGTPRDLPCEQVWPRDRAHLLDEKYDYDVVSVLIKCGWICTDALLHFHYPSLYENPMVLFCDTGDHIVIYIAKEVDRNEERA